MPTRKVDPLAVLALFNDQVPVVAIAEKFGVQRAAVYRCLYRQGIVSCDSRPGMPPAGTQLRKAANFNKRRDHAKGKGPTGITRHRATGAAAFENAPPPIEPRDPCLRCGVRGDIGCKHRRAPLGWSVG
jgi:hypothetical protein